MTFILGAVLALSIPGSVLRPDPAAAADGTNFSLSLGAVDGAIVAGTAFNAPITVANISQQTITGITVTAPNATHDCATADLGPGQSFSCTLTKTLQQSEIDAGRFHTESFTVAGTAQDDTQLNDAINDAIDVWQPAISTAVALTSGELTTGDQLVFTGSVTNTGAVPLTVNASYAASDGAACGPATIDPGQQFDCNATLTLTDADVTGGPFTNTMTVTTTLPDGSAGPEDAAGAPVPAAGGGSGSDSNASMSLTMSATVDPVEAGSTVATSFVVTNTGDSAITDISVVDGSGPEATCSATTLAAGATTNCTGEYTLLQSDIDEGEIAHSATVTGKDSSGAEVKADAQATTEVNGVASFTAQRHGTYLDANENGVIDTSDRVVVRVTITNTGTLTLAGITAADLKAGTLTCPTEPVAPNETASCYRLYPFTADEARDKAVDGTTQITLTDLSGNRELSLEANEVISLEEESPDTSTTDTTTDTSTTDTTTDTSTTETTTDTSTTDTSTTETSTTDTTTDTSTTETTTTSATVGGSTKSPAAGAGSPSTAPTTLAYTGIDAGGLAAVALALIAAGSMLVGWSRRTAEGR